MNSSLDAHTHSSVSSFLIYSFTFSANVSGALNPNKDNGRERVNPEEKKYDKWRTDIGQPVKGPWKFLLRYKAALPAIPKVN